MGAMPNNGNVLRDICGNDEEAEESVGEFDALESNVKPLWSKDRRRYSRFDDRAWQGLVLNIAVTPLWITHGVDRDLLKLLDTVC